MKLAAGEQICDGRYVLRERLGNGGMASVWLAHDERLDRPVAVKVIGDAIAGDEHWRARFEHEARAAASVSHPNIVQVFDYHVDDDLPYLVMEYVGGGNLAMRIGSDSGDPVDVDTLASSLLKALGHIHAAGILHRDIKPENILLDTDDRVRLTDFGIARSDGAAGLTSAGMVIGTLRYLAPEVAAGEPATPQSDLYATGVVLRAAAGDRPVRAAGLIEALTETRPGQRPISAAQALEILERAEHTQVTALHPAAAAAESPTTVVPVAGPQRPRWLLATFAAAVAAIALAIGVALARDDSPAPAKSKTPVAPLRVPASSATLQQQLSALDRLVDSAAK